MAPGCFTHAADRKLAIILWDIENVRLPMPPGPTPAAVLMALKQRFVFSAGFVEHKTVCCVTRTSLHAIERSWPRFAGDVVPHMDVCIGSHTTTKFAADYVLCRELSSFMREQAAHAGVRGHRASDGRPCVASGARHRCRWDGPLPGAISTVPTRRP